MMAVNRRRLGLAGVLLLAAFLNLFRLDRQGYGNLYYAATVRSMLDNWHNFFFASFDPGGFVTVDKPPLGFWIQAASARLLGFSGLPLLLPQALAGILSVGLIYLLVRKVSGPVAGLLAALVLAVTPIAVAVDRTNTIDALLLVFLLGAVWSVLRAIETGRLRWLLLGFGIVGMGFNIKMLQAYLVVPALVLAYVVGTRLPWRTRVAHLTLAAVVLVVVSFAWAVSVDRIPADQRPYVGSSTVNSELNLTLGYNGLLRVLPAEWLPASLEASFGGGAPTGMPPGSLPGGLGSMMSGALAPGPLRLFQPYFAGQIAWLLPLAVVGLVVAWQRGPTRFPRRAPHPALVLWGGWLLVNVVFFSTASAFSLIHRYYLVMLAPPIAALVGAGVAALWADYRRPGWRGWLLPTALLGTVALHATILAAYPEWAARLTPVILSLGFLAAGGLALMRSPLRIGRITDRALPVVAIAGLAAILIGPTVWSAFTTWNGTNSILPAGGPESSIAMISPTAFGAPPSGGRAAGGLLTGGAFDLFGEADPKLVDYLRAHRGGERFLLATTNALSAAPYILQTGQAVAALGGFLGTDPIIDDAGLARMVATGEARYFLAPSTTNMEAAQRLLAPAGDTSGSSPTAGHDGGMSHQNPDDVPSASASTRVSAAAANFLFSRNAAWVNAHCVPVPDDAWRSQTTAVSGLGAIETLFDCAAR